LKNKLRILVVDDDKEVRKLFKKMLKEGEYRIVTANNREEAIKKIAQEPFNMVFLDMVMPGMDRLEAFEAIKEINPEAIVIMMSGFPVENEIREAINLRATDHMKEPFNINEILTITQVARYLNVRKLTIYKLAREGQLPAFKVGGQWRFKKELLDKWIAGETKRDKLSDGKAGKD
jgi:two-component system response regulator AtoC